MDDTDWIRLRSEDVAPSVRPEDASWVFEAASPYDVPSHVRSRFNPGSGRVVIDFRYITDEPKTKVVIGPYAHALVGKKSRRIWSIDFDVHGFNRDKNRLAEAARMSIASLPASEAPNREFAMRAIAGNSKSLFKTSMSHAR